VREQGDAHTRAVVLGPQRSADERRHTEHGENPRRHARHVHALGERPVAQDCVVKPVVHAQALERGGPLLPLVEHSRAYTVGRGVKCLVDPDDPGRFLVGQRPEEFGLDRGEGGGVEADAQRKGHDGRSREPGGASQAPRCIAEVLKDRLEPEPRRGFPETFQVSCDVAEPPQRYIARVLGRKATLDLLVRLMGEMGVDLRDELLLGLTTKTREPFAH
jgi:hypothetical protein